MGDRPIIPLEDAVKTKLDWAATVPTGLAIFKAIPWPEIAAFLACVYWLIRIVERFRSKK